MFNATLRNMGVPTGNAQDGLDATGVTPPGGADGIRGWLSGIYNRLGGTLTVALSSSSPLDVSDRSARLIGHVTVDSTVAVTGTFFQATQPVSGSVSVTGTVPVSGTFWQVTQPVSGSVSVSNFPATQPVSGTFWQATQPVSLAANQSVNNAQVNGAAVVTSVTGVQDVMPRKRAGATGLSPNYTASHITTNATTTPTAATGYISTILIVVSAIGTAWTIKIQNKEATPKIIYPATTAALGVVQFNFSEPILATSGIDIVTAGTTAGTVDVFVTYWQ